MDKGLGQQLTVVDTSTGSTSTMRYVGRDPLGWLSRADGEMADRVLHTDWSSTVLGPIEDWPETLRTATSICLQSRFPILIWWGPELVMIYNDAYRPILGRSKHPQALGTPGKSVWPEIWDVIGPMLQGVLTSATATWSEDQLLPLERNGYVEECYFTFSYSPIADVSGAVCGVFCVVRETTTRVLSQRRLGTLSELAAACAAASDLDDLSARARTALCGNSADHPSVAVLRVDRDGVVRPVDGDPSAEAESSPLTEAIRQLARRVAADGRAHDAVTEDPPGVESGAGLHGYPLLRSPDDDWLVLVLGESGHRVWDADLQAYAGLCADHLRTAIASLWELDEERRRANALNELAQAKSVFFTNVSHELRTPLTLVEGPVQEVLQDPGLSAQHREGLEIVQRSTARLERMVDAMLDFSRIEVHGVSPHLQLFDVVATTRGLVASFEPSFDRAGLALTTNWECPSQEVMLDRDMYERITLNLLANALKYTKDGHVEVGLSRPSGGMIELSVTDTGAGIAPQDQVRIFERFERLPPQAWARSHEGAGIGLAMVRELAGLLGGAVSVTSAVGRGSRFTVSLPISGPPAGAGPLPSITPRRTDSFLAEVALWEAPTVAAATERTTVQSETSHFAGSDPATEGLPSLLIADDNADMLRFIASALEGSFRITTAADGSAALALIRGERPDIVLADVMMPGLGGLDLVRAIRADAALADVPVVLLSARAGQLDSESGLEVGADDYLVKPFAVRDLRARLSANLERARSRTRDAAWRRAITESLRDPMLITDDSGLVIEANEAYLQVLGTPPTHVPPELERAGGAAVPVVTSSGQTTWVTAERHRVEGVYDRPPVVVHVLRDVTRERQDLERRRTAATISSEFGSADDLSQVFGVAMAGFAGLFGGECTLVARIGDSTTAFTSAGPVPTTELGTDSRRALDETSPAYEDVAAADTPGLLLVAAHRPEQIRVWVEFGRPRAVSADERIVGDLMIQAFSLAVDRVSAAQEAAERQLHFERALESHRLIGQAVGVLVERHKVTAQDAFAQIKQLSQQRNIKLRDLAARIIETGETP